MALIKLGGLVTAISGKVGGQTLGTSASGSYMKNSGTPRKSISLLQQQKMQRMATSAQAWRGLSDAQRLSFNVASPDYPYLNRVGETKFYSGYAIYTKLRNNLLNVGSSNLPEALPLHSFIPFENVEVTEASEVLTIDATTSVDTSATYNLFCSRPSSRGITSSYKNQFYLVTLDYSQIAAGYDFTAEFVAKFGPLQSSYKFFWRLDGIDLDSGQVLRNMASGELYVA